MQVNKRLSTPVWLIYPIVLFPFISALAANFMARNGLLLIYLLIGLTAFAADLKLEPSFADYLYPILIVAVSLSLLLSTTLMSPYITGFDSHQEFALFQQVMQQGSWQPQVSILYNAALSVTILPTMIATISSVEGALVFKIVYPMIFSLVPMILYRIYRKIMGPEGAFLAAFAFLSYSGSYIDMSQLGRQMIAELIMVLLFWVQFSDLRNKRGSLLLVLFLTVGLVLSHYSLALVYLFLVGFSVLIPRIKRLGMDPVGSGAYLAISAAVIVGWFFFAAGGIVIQNLFTAFGPVWQGLSEFLNPTSRPYQLTSALGLGAINYGIFHLLNRATQYLVVICIILGLLIFLHKKRKSRIERALAPMMVASMGFLLASLVLPYLAQTLVLTRFYQIALILLSPCFYFGAAKIVGGFKWILSSATRRHIRLGNSLPAALLFSYLLFTAGWVWAVTSDQPTSVVLDMNRMASYPNLSISLSYYYWYVTPQDVAATRWLRSQGVAMLCGDWISRFHVLNSYGEYPRSDPILPGCYSPTANGFQHEYSYVYLALGNSLLGVGISANNKGLPTYTFPLNSTKTSFYNWDNRIYSDGAIVYTSLST